MFAPRVSAFHYGERDYGEGAYSGVESEEEDTECGRDHPTGELRITSISSGDMHLKIRFEGVEGKYSEFEVRWGLSESLVREDSNSEVFGNRRTRSYVIEDLQPSQSYFVKLRALNGCAKGEWSDVVMGSTLNVTDENSLTTTEVVDYEVMVEASGTPREEVAESTETNGVVLHTLKVKVIDSKRQPVEGAVVEISELNISGVTVGDGIVVFNDVPSGWYEVGVKNSEANGLQRVGLNEKSPSTVELTVQIVGKSKAVVQDIPVVWMGSAAIAFVALFILGRKFLVRKHRG